LILANPAARLLFGLGIDAEIGQPVERVIKQRELFELLRDPKTEKRSLEVVFTQGQVYLAAVSDVIAEGQKVGRVCLLRDVTRFKELDTLKTEFVSTVSHDLRTPLTLIRGYATMLEMVGPLNEQQTGYARKIIGGAENMSRLVNNLLDLGRIEAGVGLKPEMISASELATRVIDGLQVQANQKKIQLRWEHTQQPNLLVEADPALLQQALHNLVENAIKYSRNDGKVTVLVNSQKDRMIFEVSDNGIGISPMDQARLFEKFYHPPQQVGADQSGSGLGLAIVRSVAEKHGGQVWLESQLGKGSTFYLAIPLRQAQK
jgi:signal transduction histidine kinase